MPRAEGATKREEVLTLKLSGSQPFGQKWEREKRSGAWGQVGRGQCCLLWDRGLPGSVFRLQIMERKSRGASY